MNKDRLKKLEGIAIEILPNIIFDVIGKEAEAEFKLITITGVKISTDLSYMDILVSAIQNSDKLTKFLAEYTHDIQRRFNKEISIRKLPRIRFRLDEVGAKSVGMNSLMNEISSELNKNK